MQEGRVPEHVDAGEGGRAKGFLRCGHVATGLCWRDLAVFAFYALVTLFRKVASSIAIPLALLMLDRSGFVSNVSAQPESAVWAIRILMGPIPSVFLLGGIIFAIYYPLSREVHQETREKISKRRAVAD